MLDRIDFSASKISKETYKTIHDEMVNQLVMLQQEAQRQSLGVVVLLEGWNGAGKGSRISDIIYDLDARYTSVHVTENIDFKEAKKFTRLDNGVTGFFPSMQEFWSALGSRGTITFFDRGWYTKALQKMLYAAFGKDLGISKKDFSMIKRKQQQRIMDASAESIKAYEKQLTENGYVVLKFFLHITQEKQKERLSMLYDDPATRWRVTKHDLKSVNNYDQAYRLYDNILKNTDFDFAPWVIINGEDKRRANLEIALAMAESVRLALKHKEQGEEKAALTGKIAFAEQRLTVREEAVSDGSPGKSAPTTRFEIVPDPPSLAAVDYTLALSKEEYRIALKEEQDRLCRLELRMYLERIPLLVMMEGWDAAGKGGAIKRVAQALDARAYTIFPSPAPTPTELLHPHLWRYWTRLPKAGHVGLYDRSWYGRVLVERVEGFALREEWMRAYDEINEFEYDLTSWGAILLKFWVEIGSEEQLRRFHARADDPLKQWKITDDDWRNREKRPAYEEAVEDMFRLTSTTHAPWTILESDDKLYARVKALRTINETLEARLRKNDTVS